MAMANIQIDVVVSGDWKGHRKVLKSAADHLHLMAGAAGTQIPTPEEYGRRRRREQVRDRVRRYRAKSG